MLIVCPKCFAQYAISDEIRVQKGQKFHCSACENYFVLDQGNTSAGEDESEIIPTVSAVMQSAMQSATEQQNVRRMPINTHSAPHAPMAQPQIEPMARANSTDRVEMTYNSQSAHNDSRFAPQNESAHAQMMHVAPTQQPKATPLQSTPNVQINEQQMQTPPVSPTVPFGIPSHAGVGMGTEMGAGAIPNPTPAMHSMQPNATATPLQTPTLFADEPALHGGEPRFEEPLSLLAGEKPDPNARLDSLPEEFKPVSQPKKKSSFLGTVFWLCVAGGICYGAYAQKDFLLNRLDSFILNQLDKTAVSSANQGAEKASASATTSATKNNTASAVNKANESPSQKRATTAKQTAFAQKQTNTAPKNSHVAPQNSNTAGITQQTGDNRVLPNTQSAQGATTVSPKKTEARTNANKSTSTTTKITANTIENTAPNTSINTTVSATTNAVRSETDAKANPTNTALNTSTVPMNANANQSTGLMQQGLPGLSESDLPKAETDTDTNTNATINTKTNPEIQSTQPANESGTQEATPTEQPVQVVREQAVVPPSFAPLAERATPSVAEIANILKIQNISYSVAPNEAGTMRLLIKGEIANTELTTLVIPEIKAVVYDENDMVVARKRIIVSQPQIEGNSVQPFFSSVVPAPQQVSRVEVVFDE